MYYILVEYRFDLSYIYNSKNIYMFLKSKLQAVLLVVGSNALTKGSWICLSSL